MGTIVMSGTVVLVILGFGNHVYWLAAVAVLFLYLQYGRSPSVPTGRPGGGPGGGSSSGGGMPADYRSYRDRRDMQAKWERRYRRERPLESRRQEREKSK
ncbi:MULTISPECIES: hypothetical protein [Streptomyces]|uniref:Uncharacterized protein n=1 Tax=Streptomyces chartreusis TaxID=1969 RepID=A0A7H8TF97_STRCX|nr:MULTISPECIES: hypothetical protein [Streptomyces]MBT1091568.1 hypothetical protein [Streptomyces sp. Tu102]QKZ22047.1 hypothetical protein HUT05_34690 [Streptomyces chartreusis]RSN76964.1 hypothetical protein DMH26_40865 [Streptomyces sp. WAC 05379]